MSDRQLIADLLSALEYHTEQTRPIEFSRVAIEAAREYLRKPAQQQEPFCYHDGHDIVGKEFADHSDVFPLYTSPPASKPLTDAQIEQCMKQAYATVQGRNLEHAFARAIEAAHGITGERK